MQQIAMIWLIYRLTSSLVVLGFVGFLSQIPVLFLSPIAGVLADRVDKKKMLFITQLIYLFLAFLFFTLLLMNILHIPGLLVLVFLYGINSAFDMTARQSYFVELIDKKEDLSNAIALNSVAFHGSRLIGPAIAGFIIKFWGESICFFLNGVSYIPFIIALVLITSKHKKEAEAKISTVNKIKEGFAYILGHEVIFAVMVLVSIVSFMGMSYVVLLPAVVKTIFHSDSALLGIFMSSAGLGAFCGAILLAFKERITYLANTIRYCTFFLAVSLIGLPFTNSMAVAIVLLVVLGFNMMMILGGSHLILQTLTEHKYRGRVVSVYSMAFAGTIPIGNLINGYLSSTLGLQYTFLLCGIACLIGGLIFSLKTKAVKHRIESAYNN